MTKHTRTIKSLQHQPNTPSKNNSTHFIFILLLIAVTALCFSSKLSLGFVDWDDPANLLENAILKILSTQWSWPTIAHILSSPVDANFNPLPVISYAIEIFPFAPVHFACYGVPPAN